MVATAKCVVKVISVLHVMLLQLVLVWSSRRQYEKLKRASLSVEEHKLGRDLFRWLFLCSCFFVHCLMENAQAAGCLNQRHIYLPSSLHSKY